MTDLSHAIVRALERKSPTLFAGSGIACRVGFPTWPQFLEHLAKVCEEYEDSLSAQLIHQRVKASQFLSAATVYKTCEAIPLGERWKHLAAPFLSSVESNVIERLVPLIDLGFSAIVTTNYDHSLHAITAKSMGWCRPVERGDGSLRGASLISDFFIARIHGRAEIPTSMVVDSLDYERLDSDTEYLDFLLDILRTRSCVFIGFSFADPALLKVLSLFEARFGPVYPTLHSALIPRGSHDLEARLKHVNIDVMHYDPADGHRELWQAIRDASELKRREGIASPVGVATAPGLQRFMAFAYTQMLGSRQAMPLTSVVQDGIVLSELSLVEATTEQQLAEIIRPVFRVSLDEAVGLVNSSLGRLFARNQIDRTPEGIRKLSATEDDLEKDIETIAQDALDRMRVRGAPEVGDAELGIAKRALEAIFLTRAWDLAAHFAGSASGWGTDLRRVIDGIVLEAAGHRRLPLLPLLGSALLDLLQAPEDRQAPILARIGRAAFGLQLVLSTPRQVLFQRFSLPEKLYLDANVLMPAITEGHPLRPVYAESLARLGEAGAQVGLTLEICVGEQFLNEIVSHRQLAKDLVKDLNLEDRDRLTRHILYYGATNTNVFIAAYASAVGRQKRPLPFSRFLEKFAPFENEAELIAFLRNTNIKAAKMEFYEDEQAYYTSVLNPLLEDYAHSSRIGERQKESILIQHEALQLAQLRLDIASGRRVVFVTADNRLRRLLQQDSRLHDLAGLTTTQIGLVALVDVMVGFEADSRSVSRLVWAQGQTDSEKALFDYFVALGLRNYQEGMAMEMQEAAKSVAMAAAKEARNRGIDLHGKREGEIAKSAKFIDRYEDLFFRNWRQAIEKKEAEEKR